MSRQSKQCSTMTHKETGEDVQLCGGGGGGGSGSGGGGGRSSSSSSSMTYGYF
jgi:hypothetical protein